jgi:hypothetical protein
MVVGGVNDEFVGRAKDSEFGPLWQEHINKFEFIDMIVIALFRGYHNLRPLFFADSPGIQ